MTLAYLGLGSNIDPLNYLAWGIEALRQRFGHVRLSTAYQSPAYGFDGAPFINLVAAIEYTQTPWQLARELREIEFEYGREPEANKFSDRTLDMDLLLHGSCVLNSSSLTLPRRDVLTRDYVLGPLAELAPWRRHPVNGRFISALWQDYQAHRRVSLTPIDL